MDLSGNIKNKFMPSGIFDRHTESLEDTACRLEMLVRQMYYIARDAEYTGYADHDTLMGYTNSILYSALEYEKRIMRMSHNRPTKRPKIHGNEARLTNIFKESLRTQYENLRKDCNERLSERTSEKA